MKNNSQKKCTTYLPRIDRDTGFTAGRTYQRQVLQESLRKIHAAVKAPRTLAPLCDRPVEIDQRPAARAQECRGGGHIGMRGIIRVEAKRWPAKLVKIGA